MYADKGLNQSSGVSPHFLALGKRFLMLFLLCSLFLGLAMKETQSPRSYEGCDPGHVSKSWTHLKADGVNGKAPAGSDGSWTRQH